MAARPRRRRALVIDGDPTTRDATSVALLEAGFEVSMAASGTAAVVTMEAAAPDLIVLGALFRDRSYLDVLREIQARDDVPVIMLGARSSDAERILAVELGAVDDAAKPTWTVGPLRIDLARHEVTLGDRPIDVTASEFRLLALLGGRPGAVFRRRQIMEHLWAGPYFGDGHPVDTHVLNLRRKIEADPSRPKRLLTVRGVGFKLVAA